MDFIDQKYFAIKKLYKLNPCFILVAISFVCRRVHEHEDDKRSDCLPIHYLQPIEIRLVLVFYPSGRQRASHDLKAGLTRKILITAFYAHATNKLLNFNLFAFG